jgi:hypothetical protein
MNTNDDDDIEDDMEDDMEDVENLNEPELSLLIDSLIDLYCSKFGVNGMDDLLELEPDKPDFSIENLSTAKDILKNYRLNKDKK